MSKTSITCRDFVASIGEYHDGEIPAPRRERLAAHQSQCEKCTSYLKSYTHAVKLAKDAYSQEKDTTPDDLVRSIMAAHRKRRPQ